MGRISDTERISILRDYERAYFAANGWHAELYRRDNGRYSVLGTQLHYGRKGYGTEYEIYELPSMTRNLRSTAEQDQAKLLRDLIFRLAPVNIREVITNEFQTSERDQ